MQRRAGKLALSLFAISACALAGCVENRLMASAYDVTIAHISPETFPPDGAGAIAEPSALAAMPIDE